VANRFSVNPLGGFNIGGALQGLGQQYREQERYDTQQQEKEDLRAFTVQAQSGDPIAMKELFARDPRIAMAIEQRNEEKAAMMNSQEAALSKDAEIDWGMAWKQAQTPEEKEALMQQAVTSPLIDIEESDIGTEGPMADLAVNTMLYGHMGDKAYNQFFGGQDMKKPMTDYQQAMIEESKADREIRKFEAENKRIDSQLKKETNEVKLQELKNKKTDNEEKRNQIKKGRSDAAQSVVDSGKSTLDLITKIEDHPGFESAIGAKGGSSLYGLMDEPFAGTEAAGVRSLIETLEAQNFLTAIGEFKSAGGAGSLSDNEGKKLGAALSNLSVAQNEKDFKKSLTVIRNLVKKQMSKAAPQIEKRFSLDPSKTSKANDKIDLSKLTLQELKALRAKG